MQPFIFNVWMKRSKRPNHQRLNYRVLHSDGIKTVISSSDSESDVSVSVSDTDSQNLSNTSNKLLDPLLISRFEDLSCQTNSKIQFDPVKESITQSVSNSLERLSYLNNCSWITRNRDSSAGIRSGFFFHQTVIIASS